jgi:aminoglycoside phosphotransferase family enzyme
MTGHILKVNCPELAQREVEFLRRPEHYPEPTSRVDFVESHMAWVFLTDRFAYKMKKPVSNTFLDFSTVDLRRRDCLLEVQLNRRLAADVYHGVVPLFRDDHRQFRLGTCHSPGSPDDRLEQSADVLDWLVKMRRLPAERMLDRAIMNRTLHEDSIDEVGRLLATFYRNATPVTMEPSAWVDRLLAEIEGNRQALLEPRFGLCEQQITGIARRQSGRIQQHRSWLQQRVARGRIVDAHGDLRPEHICLESPPVIIDCLEFNQHLRTLDAASDLAFLILECDRLGAPEIGQQLRQAYISGTADHPEQELWALYQSHHALSRSKIAIWHLDIPGLNSRQTWIDKASQYLRIAERLLD